MANFGDTKMGNNTYTDNAGSGSKHWIANKGGDAALANTPWLLPA